MTQPNVQPYMQRSTPPLVKTTVSSDGPQEELIMKKIRFIMILNWIIVGLVFLAIILILVMCGNDKRRKKRETPRIPKATDEQDIMNDEDDAISVHQKNL